jgi:Relaxase/Mobilisation nuclease domain
MTNEANDLGILEDLIKGKKAKNTYKNRYAHPKKDNKNGTNRITYKGSFNRKTSDMLRTASGKKQAILKITSYGKGEKIRNHLRYISRRGVLELEDQDGKKITTISEQNALLRYWSLDFDNIKNSRDSLHLVLSTPPGSDRESAKNTAREFLKGEYGKLGHEYLFVAHNDTDHPHIHAVIKMRSIYGKKLDPRKVDLRKARKKFAEKCRDHGIEVEASSRAERGLSGKSKRSELVQMNRSKRTPHVDKTLIEKVKKEREEGKTNQHPAQEKTLKRNQIIRKRYAERSRMLKERAAVTPNENEKKQYQAESTLLDNYAKNLPVETDRGEKIHRQLDQKYGTPAHRSFKPNEEMEIKNQYEAVKKGRVDERGIFLSPAEELAKVITKVQTQQKEHEKINKINQMDLEDEQEIDFDD